jgi:signal transduction histidine kinase
MIPAYLQLTLWTKFSWIQVWLILTSLSNIIILIVFFRAMQVTLHKLKKWRKKYSRQGSIVIRLQDTVAQSERINQNYLRLMRAMAHDLRTPLGGIMGLAGLLLDEEEFSEDSRKLLELIASTGSHSLEMINELLKSGIEEENKKIPMSEINIHDLLYDSVELLQHSANQKQQTINFHSSGDGLKTNINQEKIWRVFNNLIVNAIKFSHVGGDIEVSVQGKEDKILVAVSDKGIGISEKDQQAVFQMFTPAKREGTVGEKPFGIGLSISKRIIEQHNGEIWVSSSPATGTTFYVALPKS